MLFLTVKYSIVGTVVKLGAESGIEKIECCVRRISTGVPSFA